MAKTAHGFHIPGTINEGPPNKMQHRCGGPKSDCKTCLGDIEFFQSFRKNPIDKARMLVLEYVDRHLDKSDPVPEFEVYVVLFSYILGGWKAHMSTTLPDGMYYEVTYDSAKKKTYIDAYKKFENIVVED